MNKYNAFLFLFLVSVIAFIFFMGFYMKGILSLVFHGINGREPNPFEVLSTIFNPYVIITLVIVAITSLANRILGIVLVLKNKTVSEGEKAIWVVGFLLMSFVTSIVFLIMARGRKFV